jgi:hypothetical protein
MTKKPTKVEFSGSQNFLSPNRDKIQSPPSSINIPNNKKSPRKKSKSLPKQQIAQTASSSNLLKSRLQSPPKDSTVKIPNNQPQSAQDRKRYL